ncbi:MAG TPA: GNAT family N-acetyltransferase [Candidatus Deferrimicrobiaceae bacterium]|nr:GNAT family N-acetyltransferase [Candidatus Deferrimicrobiaceae bacterium]
MTPTLEAEPDCARAERRPFDSIPASTWDRLAARNPAATPFSAWAFHRAWWDGYGENAHDETIAIVGDVGAEPVAIAPLMHRHVVEPGDAETATQLRHGEAPELTPVAATAKAVYFGASYHADYATLLADPAELPAAADALADAFAAASPADLDPAQPGPWDVIDLRRLRLGDPAAEALATAFGAREIDSGWTLNLEREDVCPVVHIEPGADLDTYLGQLPRKERHEIRRKVRRAEAVGPVELVEPPDPLVELDAFIDLHQRRWGDEGLFPATRGGDQSRRFVRRLFELFPSPLGTAHLTFLEVGGRRVASAVHFETADRLLFYNAGIDPDARALSPGVCLTERMLRRAIERGLTRLDFLRGNEPYKYDWGAVDEPIQRLLVRRTVRR